jgi:hypothetical protein
MNPGTPRKAIPPPPLPNKQIAAWLETLFNTIK